MTDSFPPPKSTAAILPKEQLVRQFAFLGDILTAGTLLVDVRRDDFDGGTIKGSLNIPAQGFYLSMPALHRLCVGDGVDVITRVVFYCGVCLAVSSYVDIVDIGECPALILAGSCGSRGPRCAGWFKDYVADMAVKACEPAKIEVFALEGGIKGWVAAGDQYLRCMDGFKPEHWKQFEKTDSGQ
jgi:arsenical-resistance protein 2